MERKFLISLAGFMLGGSLQALSQSRTSLTEEVFVTPVNTITRPVDRQWKGTMVEGISGTFFSNNFPGGRLSAVRWLGESAISLTFEPEHADVEVSPWYAFKVWADTTKQIRLQLEYPPGIRHQYAPKISRDGQHWEEITGKAIDHGFKYVFDLTVAKDTLMIAAQPLVTSLDVVAWVDSLTGAVPGITVSQIGQSRMGKPIGVMHFGDTSSNQKILLIGRQHPAAVTAHWALAGFVEALLSGSAETASLLEDFHLCVVPMVNPDGVDEGFWRYNYNGADLNHDWADFNQPETQAIQSFVAEQAREGAVWRLAIDFNATDSGGYYTIGTADQSQRSALVGRWLQEVDASIEGYVPKIRSVSPAPPKSMAYRYFYETYGAASLVYATSFAEGRGGIVEKSKVAALALARVISSASEL